MIEVEIESADEFPQLMRDPTSADVAALIELREQDSSTMITISGTSEADQQLLVALSTGRAFVGLVSDGQQFQLTNQIIEEGLVEMVLGGQATLVDSKFSVEPRYAARAAVAFIDGNPLEDPTLKWNVQ